MPVQNLLLAINSGSSLYSVLLTLLPLLCSPSAELSDPTLIIDPITEERASRTLYRIELLRRIREQVLPHPLLMERLKLCQPSPDLPEWWECGRHDHDLLLGACKHGVSRTDYHILNDPSLGFLESHQRYTNQKSSGVYVGVQAETPKPDIATAAAAPLLTPAELASAAAAAAKVVAKEEEAEDKEVKMEEEKPDAEVKIKEEVDVADGAHSEMEVPEEKEDKSEVGTDGTTINVKQEEEQPKVEKKEEEEAKEMQSDEQTTTKQADDQDNDPKEPEEASTLDAVGEQKEASAELQKELATSPTVPQEEHKAGEEEREEKENPDSPKSLKSADTEKSPEEEDEERIDEDDKSEKSSQAEGEEDKVVGPQVQVSVVKVLSGPGHLNLKKKFS